MNVDTMQLMNTLGEVTAQANDAKRKLMQRYFLTAFQKKKWFNYLGTARN